jgi:hypothetical protein
MATHGEIARVQTETGVQPGPGGGLAGRPRAARRRAARRRARRGSPGLRARLLAGGAWAAGAAAAFAVYLRLAQTRAVNSDGASQALQAWDMLHGNPLLRGWTVSDVSFYTTELPQYAIIELVRGLRADVVDTAAAVTYTLAVLLAALVAKGTAPGRQGLLRAAFAAAIMLAPQLASGTNVLLSSPDHIGTSVPLLATWLVIDRLGAGDRPAWYVPAVASALLCLAEVADSLVLVAGIIPLALVCTARAVQAALDRSDSGWQGGWRRAAGYQLAMAGGALAAAGAAHWILRAVTAAGGFTVRPLSTQLGPAGVIVRHNLPLAGQCLLVLFGADPSAPSAGESPAFLWLHLAGVALAGAGIVAAALRLRGGGDPGLRGADLVSQVLLAAIAVNLGAFLVTQRVTDLASAREIAPVLPFAAALAGRQLGPAISALRLSPLPWSLLPWSLLLLAGAGYLAGLGTELAAPAAAPQAGQLTGWLTAHRLAGDGLGGFWQASVVTLASGGSVAVRPVADLGTGVGAHPGEINDAWFDPRRSAAHFVVLASGEPGYPGYADEQAVLATWGPPARVYRAGLYTIWYWPDNLLTGLRR